MVCQVKKYNYLNGKESCRILRLLSVIFVVCFFYGGKIVIFLYDYFIYKGYDMFIIFLYSKIWGLNCFSQGVQIYEKKILFVLGLELDRMILLFWFSFACRVYFFLIGM